MGRGAWQEGLVPPARRPRRTKGPERHRLSKSCSAYREINANHKGAAFRSRIRTVRAGQKDLKGFAFQKAASRTAEIERGFFASLRMTTRGEV